MDYVKGFGQCLSSSCQNTIAQPNKKFKAIEFVTKNLNACYSYALKNREWTCIVLAGGALSLVMAIFYLKLKKLDATFTLSLSSVHASHPLVESHPLSDPLETTRSRMELPEFLGEEVRFVGEATESILCSVLGVAFWSADMVFPPLSKEEFNQLKQSVKDGDGFFEAD